MATKAAVSAPFTSRLRFVEFTAGKKVVLRSDNGVRHWMKQSVFQDMINNGFPGNGGWTLGGLWLETEWVTERRGVSILTRPANMPTTKKAKGK